MNSLGNTVSMMILHHSPASPFVRKVMACAIARGLDGQIELVATNPHVSPAGLLADNPLCKVPALTTTDGVGLFDSPVICEYLDSLGDAARLFPPAGGARWVALRLAAMGDGIMDAAVGRRMQMSLPQDDGRVAFDARQAAAVTRTLDQLEAEAGSLDGPQTIGTVTVGCALGYLEFRFPHEPWATTRPQLAEWWREASGLEMFARTTPKG